MEAVPVSIQAWIVAAIAAAATGDGAGVGGGGGNGLGGGTDTNGAVNGANAAQKAVSPAVRATNPAGGGLRIVASRIGCMADAPASRAPGLAKGFEQAVMYVLNADVHFSARTAAGTGPVAWLTKS